MSATIRKSLLSFIFNGTYMRRWNDKLRPIEFVEIDKQAHKMIVAWILLELNSKDLDYNKKAQLFEEVVRGGIFEYLFRLVVTDIKPSIFLKIKETPEDFKSLTNWVLGILEPRLLPLGENFWNEFKDYFENPPRENCLSQRILRASHTFASQWELSILKNFNPDDEEIIVIEKKFIKELKDLEETLIGLKLLGNTKIGIGALANICGRLRFQTRWSQVPRIPETSVLGHMFAVGLLAYCFSLTETIGACPIRRVNNFFTGLFHDIPELLTRDIISPIKSSAEGIKSIIKKCEATEMKSKIFDPLINAGFQNLTEKLEFYLGLKLGSEFDEFNEAVIENDKIIAVKFEDLTNKYNHNQFNPKDGKLIKICDDLTAFLEAYAAMKNGINSKEFTFAICRIHDKYKKDDLSQKLQLYTILADFD